MENGSASEGRDPSGFLSEIIGAPVTVKLNSGVVYKGLTIPARIIEPVSLSADNVIGELQSVDGYMNIALEKTEEFVNGEKRRAYGDAFVRGNNGKVSARETRSKLSDAQSCTSPPMPKMWALACPRVPQNLEMPLVCQRPVSKASGLTAQEPQTRARRIASCDFTLGSTRPNTPWWTHAMRLLLARSAQRPLLPSPAALFLLFPVFSQSRFR